MPNPESDHELAHRLAAETAAQLLVLQREGIEAGQRGWSLEQIGDSAAHDFLFAAISEARPDDGLLSEEGDDDGARTAKHRSWIVDPLDGSSGFGRGNAEWAVHVALSIDGLPDVGAVAVPGMDSTGSTHSIPTLHARGDRKPIIVTGRTRAHTDGAFLARELGADLVACSSAGVKAMLVMAGKADVYVHDGPLYEWDVCAPVAVALAAGLDAVTSLGEEIVFNKPRPVVESLVISQPEFTPLVLSALRRR